jgi:hypothetical protein
MRLLDGLQVQFPSIAIPRELPELRCFVLTAAASVKGDLRDLVLQFGGSVANEVASCVVKEPKITPPLEEIDVPSLRFGTVTQLSFASSQ